MRVPRITGLSSMTFGLTSIRSLARMILASHGAWQDAPSLKFEEG
jgi:hypothetical protein